MKFIRKKIWKKLELQQILVKKKKDCKTFCPTYSPRHWQAGPPLIRISQHCTVRNWCKNVFTISIDGLVAMVIRIQYV
jgi:hypothetical protein